LVLCSACKREHVTWRGERILSAADLTLAEPGPQVCHPCAVDHEASDDPTYLRAKFTHRRL
jgi:hypothetical protein